MAELLGNVLDVVDEAACVMWANNWKLFEGGVEELRNSFEFFGGDDELFFGKCVWKERVAVP